MTIEITKDFFVEVSEESVQQDVNLRVMLYLAEVRKAMETMRVSAYDSSEYKNAYHVGDLFYRGWDGDASVMSGLMDYVAYNAEYSHLYKQVYSLWSEFNDLNDAKYEEHYRADFKAFEAKNVDYVKGLWIGSEEDYNFYSDWSKDMFGYRKRWRVASRLSE